MRGDDSFRVFEEVLELAKSNDADMVLLGGDLFHDNKPSRSTLVKTMKILRRHCLSPEGEVRLAVRSDPSVVNYMNPCVAVSLPVFVIHGNHDDPTGGAGPDALSSLDLLENAGLVTYFGRAVSSKKVEVSPILLQKGNTGLALYGLGNIRDEILYDTWARQKRVKWLSPAQPSRLVRDEMHDDDDSESPNLPTNDLSWFNLFVLHQNRVTRGSSRGISDTLLPPWLDYVVWGHEHDSIPDLTLQKPPILQPGSTVATSLSEGEGKPKHAVLLEVFRGKFKHRAVPLYTVRNFKFEDMVLSEQEGISETDPDGLAKFLDNIVEQLVKQEESTFDTKLSGFQGGTSMEMVHSVRYPPRSFYVRKLTPLVRQPLVRLRVEATGNWEIPNPHRFGQKYVGRVACPADILHKYTRKRKPLKRSRLFLQGYARGDGLHDEDGEDNENDISLTQGGEQQDVVQIPKLVQYFLYHKKAGGTGLKFLELDRLCGAVDQFVTRMENRAIPDYVATYLKEQQEKTMKEADRGNQLDEEQLLEKFRTEANDAANRVFAEKNNENEHDDDGSSRPASKPIEGNEDMNDVPGDVDSVLPVRQPPRFDGIQAGLEDVHALVSNNPNIVAATRTLTLHASDDEQEQPAAAAIKAGGRSRGRTRGRGRDRTGTAGRASVSSRRPPAATRRKTQRKLHSYMVDDSDDNEEGVETEKPRNQVVIEASDEEEYVPVSASRKRRARASPAGSRLSSMPRVEPSSRATARARASPAGTRQSPTSRSQAPSRAATRPLARRSVFAGRARARRSTGTIDVDEEGGDDAL